MNTTFSKIVKFAHRGVPYTACVLSKQQKNMTFRIFFDAESPNENDFGLLLEELEIERNAEPKQKLVLRQLSHEQDNGDILKLCCVFGNVIRFERPPYLKHFAFITFEELR